MTDAAAAPPVPGSLVGAYRCTFQTGPYRYPPFACAIRDDGGTLRFEKDQGSQRIRATISPTPDGFELTGTFYCPWGACTDSIHGTFRRDPQGRYLGSIHPNGSSIRVTIAPADAQTPTTTPTPSAARRRRPRRIDMIEF